MNINEIQPVNYIYTYASNEDERSLCNLEMRSFFGFDTQHSILESPIKVDPNRSPFIKERINVMFEADCLEDMFRKMEDVQIVGQTFKVSFVKNDDLSKVGFDERRTIEREIGLRIGGEVDLINPELLIGIMKVKRGWVFGKCYKSEAIWLQHRSKPQNYSTALGTRVARAVVNIAAPEPTGKKLIDPCCGIGTVLIEALSMGIDIVGRDLNHLVVPGARENIAHFGLTGEVSLGDIRMVEGNYDVAIIDMPYNLCSVLSPEDQLEMLESARRFAKKVVIITIETIDSFIERAGFVIVDRCVAKKGAFTRQILVCE